MDPTYTSVGDLFVNKPMFFVPKYQRAYAWDSDSVDDFIKDLQTVFNKRKNGSPVTHFFGGVLSVEYSVQGAVRQHEYEIIDGQQRISTFTLLISCLVSRYKLLKEELEKNGGDPKNESYVSERISDLSARFLEFGQEVQRQRKTIEVLRMSKADSNFYRDLVRGKSPLKGRDSHRRMESAYFAINKSVGEMIDTSSVINQMDDLEIIQYTVDQDFTILHMVTKTRGDAFRLFQVINDRGTSLTEGDLLKSRTLELLETYTYEQEKAEEIWDDILADAPRDTANYLNWIYDSYKGKSMVKNSIFDQFLDAFFPQNNQEISQDDAQQILNSLEILLVDIKRCRKLADGEWLYPNSSSVQGWDRNRLSLLVKELGHTLAMPLLLAASDLKQKDFSEIVQMLERTFFRYKIICNQHANPLLAIYRSECLAIRRDSVQYNAMSLRTKLTELLKKKASDEDFKRQIQTLKYHESGGGSNKPLKYLLITIEYYYQWYKSGAKGKFKIDKTKIHDFAGTSIEHIYSKKMSSDSSHYSTAMEELKHSLGNLTILDPNQNSEIGNNGFSEKKKIFNESSILLTKESIGTQNDWSPKTIEAHRDLLTQIALAVFKP
jgi:hypothetical protein